MRMSLGLIEYFDLPSSVYASDIAGFCILFLSSTLQKVLEYF